MGMEKPKRSYYLPAKLVTAFDRECSKSGYVKEKVVAAAMLSFLDSNPEARNNLFERLDVFLRGKRADAPVKAGAPAPATLKPTRAKKARGIRSVDEIPRATASR